MPSEANVRRVCLLTGSAGKLGRAFITKFSNHYDFVAVYNSAIPEIESQLARFVDPLGVDPPTIPAKAAYLIQADLRDRSSTKRIIELIDARYGGVDLVVNAAADVRFHGSLEDIEELYYRFLEQITLNAIMPIYLAAGVARHFWRTDVEENQRRNRNIVNISSTSGSQIFARSGQAAYSASKAALNFLTCHLAADLKMYRIRVNALAPTAFPAKISAEVVADAVRRLDQGQRNGKIVMLDENFEREISDYSA